MKLNYSRKHTLTSNHYIAQPFVNINTFSYNVILNTYDSSAYIPVHITNRLQAGRCTYRHIKARNVIEINSSTEDGGDKKLHVKKLHLSVLDARSVNNKSLLINDYVVEMQIDILAITETWLKGGEVEVIAQGFMVAVVVLIFF